MIGIGVVDPETMTYKQYIGLPNDAPVKDVIVEAGKSTLKNCAIQYSLNFGASFAYSTINEYMQNKSFPYKQILWNSHINGLDIAIETGISQIIENGIGYARGRVTLYDPIIASTSAAAITHLPYGKEACFNAAKGACMLSSFTALLRYTAIKMSKTNEDNNSSKK